MVSPTVHLPVLLVIEVDEVDQELTTVLTGEAGRMPTGVHPYSLRKHGHLTNIQSTLALLTHLQSAKSKSTPLF